MKKKHIALTLGMVCIILTMAICVQMNTIQKANSTVVGTLSENGLRDEVLKWKEKYDAIANRLGEEEKNLKNIREKSTQNDSTSAEKEEQITLNNCLLGLTKVEGTGIEMVISDDPNAAKSLDDIAKHIVHDADLRAIVNALKNAGAEAISINGQRIVNTTAITCIGNVIKINDERVTSPFTIKAIGYPESLIAVDMAGSYNDFLREWGIVIEIKKSNKVEIPKYTGAISAKYMTEKDR